MKNEKKKYRIPIAGYHMQNIRVLPYLFNINSEPPGV